MINFKISKQELQKKIHLLQRLEQVEQRAERAEQENKQLRNTLVEIGFNRFSEAETWRTTADALASELEEVEHKLGVALTLITEYSDLPWAASTENVAHGKDEGVSKIMNLIRKLEDTLNEPHIIEKLRIERGEKQEREKDAEVWKEQALEARKSWERTTLQRQEVLDQLYELFEAVRPHANISKHVYQECEDTEKLLEKLEQ